MRNYDDNYGAGSGQYEEENQRIGRELYNRDVAHGNRYQQHRNTGSHTDRKWDEGNYFHTGPNPRGAQNRPHHTQQPPSSYSQQYSHHYGSDPHSVYRDPSAINYGDRMGSTRHVGWSARGTQPGQRHDYPSINENPNYEGPGTRSRYKEDDYRYG
ncbi:MAG: hypothetical protein LPJ89_05565, partial [Hymenobacteraceae bacterium]|nr:hypothetical protein [Hymenobacteraceae bacterium]